MPGGYGASVQFLDGQLLFLVRDQLEKLLVIVTKGANTPFAAESKTTMGQFTVHMAQLTSQNAKVLRSVVPWTAPQAFGREGISMGLGDRLGLASPGHIKAIRHTRVRPVLAQQSMRELDLTQRTYQDVLDAATWAVFQEGYQAGYGADGDHLKKVEHIQAALDLGFSMITLDCSEHIDDEVAHLADSEVERRYGELPGDLRGLFAELYRERRYELSDGAFVDMGDVQFHRMVLTYYRTLDFIAMVYETVIARQARPIDFENSIDEVATPTSPQDHFFVASELRRRGVEVTSLAPRFCGSFEKGIDYVGDHQQFEEEFGLHTKIARHFGYRLSIHSGSDKFSIFPAIGKHASSSGYHIKTAGTNWLEAVRVIASQEPALYRMMHRKALDTVDQARAFYKVRLNIGAVPSLDSLSDAELPGLLDHDHARQLLHITYGFILADPVLGERVFAVLRSHEDVYERYLVAHIGRHLRALGIETE